MIVSRLLGLLRDGLLAKYLGAGWVGDAFFTAFKIPNMLRDLLGEGALSSIVVARLGKIESEGKDKTRVFVQKLIGFLGVILLSLTLLGILITPWIVDVVGIGFKDNPEQFQLTQDLTRLIFPYMGLVGLCALSMGILNHKRVFGWPASASIFFNATWISIMVVYGEIIEIKNAFDFVYVIAVCIVFAGVVQWVCLWPALISTGLSLKPIFDFKDPEVLRVLKLLGPAIISVAAVQINVFVNSTIATTLGDGGATSVNFAFRIMQLPVGIVGVSVATVLLPKLSECVAKDDAQGFGEKMSIALGKVTFLTLPAIAGLSLLGPDLIKALYERGRFDAMATQMVWLALQGYLFGILPYVMFKNLSQGFFAHSDTKFPVIVSFISIVINLGLNLTLVYVFDMGVRGLTLGTSLVLTGNCLMLYLGLKLKYDLKLDGAVLAQNWGIQLLCSGLMFLGLWCANIKLEWVVSEVVLKTVFGAMIYFGCHKLFQYFIKVSI